MKSWVVSGLQESFLLQRDEGIEKKEKIMLVFFEKIR